MHLTAAEPNVPGALHTAVEIVRSSEAMGVDDLTEREVTVLLADLATAWTELFPTEQGRIVQLPVERVDVREDALEVRIMAEGLASLVAELRQHDERRAA